MKRIQLFEFEDYNIFPAFLRSSLTNLIVVFIKMLGVSKVIAKLIADLIEDKKIDQIVDLGSGSGGAMPEVQKSLVSDYGHKNVKLVMTDLYPNKEAIKRFEATGNPNISYKNEAVNATKFETAPKGIKTIINCFHHMRPADARRILESAEKNKQSILIYELSENKLPLFIWWLFLPISLVILFVMVLFMTPFVKPLSWKQLVFTYIIPIIPIFYAWDGQASMPRTYSMNDLDELLDGLGSEKYEWKKGSAMNEKGKKTGTYLIGQAK